MCVCYDNLSLFWCTCAPCKGWSALRKQRCSHASFPPRPLHTRTHFVCLPTRRDDRHGDIHSHVYVDVYTQRTFRLALYDFNRRRESEALFVWCNWLSMGVSVRWVLSERDVMCEWNEGGIDVGIWVELLTGKLKICEWRTANEAHKKTFLQNELCMIDLQF